MHRMHRMGGRLVRDPGYPLGARDALPRPARFHPVLSSQRARLGDGRMSGGGTMGSAQPGNQRAEESDRYRARLGAARSGTGPRASRSFFTT